MVSITTCYLDPAHLPLIRAVRGELLDADAAPASTSVQAAGLGAPVEPTPLAAIPYSSSDASTP